MNKTKEDNNFLGKMYLAWIINICVLNFNIQTIHEPSFANQVFFIVLIDIDYLPRYKYHRSLLEWFMKGLPYDPAFPKCNFEDCSVIVGGNLDDEKKKELFCGADNLAFQNLQKGEEKNIIL